MNNEYGRLYEFGARPVRWWLILWLIDDDDNFDHRRGVPIYDAADDIEVLNIKDDFWRDDDDTMHNALICLDEAYAAAVTSAALLYRVLIRWCLWRAMTPDTPITDWILEWWDDLMMMTEMPGLPRWCRMMTDGVRRLLVARWVTSVDWFILDDDVNFAIWLTDLLFSWILIHFSSFSRREDSHLHRAEINWYSMISQHRLLWLEDQRREPEDDDQHFVTLSRPPGHDSWLADDRMHDNGRTSSERRLRRFSNMRADDRHTPGTDWFYRDYHFNITIYL